jgi:hypothetical protein
LDIFQIGIIKAIFIFPSLGISIRSIANGDPRLYSNSIGP